MRSPVTSWILLLALGVCGWAQDTAVALLPGYSFPAVGIVAGQQTVRITALNTVRNSVTTLPTTMPAIPCSVDVRFYDESGKIAKEETIPNLPPGTAKWVDYAPEAAIAVFPPPRIAIAGTAQLTTTSPLATSAVPIRWIPSCSVLATLEVYDNSSNKTVFALSGFVSYSPLPLGMRALTPAVSP